MNFLEWIKENQTLFLVMIAAAIVFIVYGVRGIIIAVKKIPIPKGFKRMWSFVKALLMFLTIAVLFIALQDKIFNIINSF